MDTTSNPPKPERQQLSKSMEHLRFAVTVEPVPVPKSSEEEARDAYGVPAIFNPIRKPAHRSHDATNNQKRTDPFAFGSRYLEEGDDIFEFNAWDHVETDDAYKEFAELQYARQREAPVSEFDRGRFNANPSKWWNLFYAHNRTNFFKNRKWLAQEFPILTALTTPTSPPTLLLEVGAGAGNTAFPILALNQNPALRLHACDFSARAVELVRAHEAFDPRYIRADVWDVAGAELPPGIAEGSVDVVLMIFVFSALAPAQWARAVWNVWRVLKPGGRVLFRDYGRGDLAQVRFKKGRWMEDNFYVRGDGTRVYFFEKDELERIWGGERRDNEGGEMGGEKRDEGNSGKGDERIAEGIADMTINSEEQQEEPSEEQQEKPSQPDNASVQETDKAESPAFDIVHSGVDRRMLVNRQRKLKMYRCWIQAVFRKPGEDAASNGTEDLEAPEEREAPEGREAPEDRAAPESRETPEGQEAPEDRETPEDREALEIQS